jgi:hypothetical protein
MTNTVAYSRLKSDSTDDLEALVTGLTNKKGASSTNSSPRYFFTSEMVKKLSKNFFLPATVVFALVGISSVAQNIKVYTRDQRYMESLVSIGGLAPLETNDSTNIIFDGHISKEQTKSINQLSKILGTEPYGGEKTIRKIMENVADVNSPYSSDDVPFYWEVAGTAFIGDEICKCFEINMASSSGNDEIGNPGILEPIATDGNACKTYNANLASHDGTLRAKKLGLMKDVIPDFISSPFLPEIASLFTKERKARLIVAVPNTAARIKMSYAYVKGKGLFDGTFLEFVSSGNVLANNYLTRMLSGKWVGLQELTEDDLQTAATILKEKFIVARWSDNRKVTQYIMENEHWDHNGYDCMYPPENSYSKENAQIVAQSPPPPPPTKSAEDLAVETAITLHNYWDNRLFEILNQQAIDQLGAFA